MRRHTSRVTETSFLNVSVRGWFLLVPLYILTTLLLPSCTVSAFHVFSLYNNDVYQFAALRNAVAIGSVTGHSLVWFLVRHRSQAPIIFMFTCALCCHLSIEGLKLTLSAVFFAVLGTRVRSGQSNITLTKKCDIGWGRGIIIWLAWAH